MDAHASCKHGMPATPSALLTAAAAASVMRNRAQTPPALTRMLAISCWRGCSHSFPGARMKSLTGKQEEHGVDWASSGMSLHCSTA